MGKEWVYIEVRPNSKAKIDKEDFARVNRHTWRTVTKETGRKKVVTNILHKNGRNQQVSLGQFLMKPPKGKMVYPRRFMDGFDYRKENLIVCTMAERQRILPKARKGGSSQYKGVSYIQVKKRWRAALKIDGQSLTIGHFKNEDEAALAYNKAALKHFGPNAYQNLIKAKKAKRKYDQR